MPAVRVEQSVGAFSRLSSSRRVLIGIGLVAWFLVLMSFSLRPQLADEGIYYYAALRMAEGAIPHREFFLAHFPLHLLPTALVFLACGGVNLFAAKATLFAFGAVQILVTLRIVARGVGNDSASGSGVFTAGILLVCSEAFLRLGSVDTGVVQATALAMMAVGFQLEGRGTSAGICYGLGIFCAPQVALAVFGICLIVGKPTPFGLAALSTTFLVGITWLIVCGDATGQVFAYHLLRVGPPGHARRQLLSFLVMCWPLLVAGLGSLLLSGAGAIRGLQVRLILGCIVHVASMLVVPTPFAHYFLPVLPLLATSAGLGVAAGIKRWRGRLAWPVTLTVAAPLAAAALAVLAPSPMSSKLATIRGEWFDAPLIGPLNTAIRAVLWRDEGGAIGPVTRYLWVQSCWLDQTAAIVSTIKSREPKGDVAIVGDSLIAPMVAMTGGFRILDDLIDTGSQRFGAYPELVGEVERRLTRATRAYIVTTEAGIGRTPALQGFVSQTRPLVATYTTSCGFKFVLFGPANTAVE